MDEPSKKYGNQLRNESHTLREVVFARLVSEVRYEHTEDPPMIAVSHSASPPTHTFRLPLCPLEVEPILTLVSHSDYRDQFSAIPIVSASKVVDPELHTCLQELAALIAMECRGAIADAFYPRPVDVEPMSTSHVHEVMVAMDREMEREGTRRQKTWIRYIDLPQDRQVALAERRRYWFGKFGITPESWKTGTFSLWDVADEPIPDLIGGKAFAG